MAKEAQSPNELFDVVNEADQIVDQATRSNVHKKNLLHRAIHIFVFNTKGEILLQKRSLLKDKNPGTWDSSVSGHLNAGEDYAEAAKRELVEEINPQPTFEIKEIAYIKACRKTGNEFVKVYLGFSEGPFDPDRAEIDELAWFSCNEVENLLSHSANEVSSCFKYIWNHVKQGIS